MRALHFVEHFQMNGDCVSIRLGIASQTPTANV
jgi:hypothetical protein